MSDEEDSPASSVKSYKNKPSMIVMYDPLKAGSIDGTDTFPHDRAIWRAMDATYTPCYHIGGEPKNTIFVAKLHKNTDEPSIRKVFSEFGDIKKCTLVRDLVTGFSKRYAFVEFENKRGAARAYEAGSSLCIDNMNVFVDYECGRLLKNWKPRRLGGGFGGVKQSGQLRFGGRDRPLKKPYEINFKSSSTSHRSRPY